MKKEKFYYIYSIVWYDEHKDEEKTESGIVYSTSMSEAVKRIEIDYGAENISEIKCLYPIDYAETITFEEIKNGLDVINRNLKRIKGV